MAAGSETVLVYADDLRGLSALLAHLAETRVTVVGSRGELSTRPRGTGGTYVVLRQLTDVEAVWLRRLSSAGPVTVVLPLTPTNAHSAARHAWAGVEVLWSEELDERLGQSRALSLAFERIVAHIDTAAMSPVVTRAVNAAFFAEPPPVTVHSLARHVGVTPWALRYHWGRAFSNSFAVKHLVSWATLLRHLEGSWTGRPDGARRSGGVHPRTLERICRRLTGSPLGIIRKEPSLAFHLFDRHLHLLDAAT